MVSNVEGKLWNHVGPRWIDIGRTIQFENYVGPQNYVESTSFVSDRPTILPTQYQRWTNERLLSGTVCQSIFILPFSLRSSVTEDWNLKLFFFLMFLKRTKCVKYGTKSVMLILIMLKHFDKKHALFIFALLHDITAN